jgi:hypothetical protein
MIANIRLPRPGERVKFQDGDQVRVGTMNGEAKHYSESHPETITHIPVHVHETNENLMVAASNIIEWPEEGDADNG